MGPGVWRACAAWICVHSAQSDAKLSASRKAGSAGRMAIGDLLSIGWCVESGSWSDGSRGRVCARGLAFVRCGLEVALEGRTIPHRVVGRFGAAKVILLPARPGTGVIAGASVRAGGESSGIQYVLTKSFGSSNPVNLVKATINGLRSLRSRSEVERLRGVSL